MPDVIRFGGRFVPQSAKGAEALSIVIADLAGRKWQTEGARLAKTTLHLRQQGVTVRTPVDRRRRNETATAQAYARKRDA